MTLERLEELNNFVKNIINGEPWNDLIKLKKLFEIFNNADDNSIVEKMQFSSTEEKGYVKYKLFLEIIDIIKMDVLMVATPYFISVIFLISTNWRRR